MLFLYMYTIIIINTFILDIIIINIFILDYSKSSRRLGTR